jgi:outer membrane protein OmpA-like peptidoglycan-associated protein
MRCFLLCLIFLGIIGNAKSQVVLSANKKALKIYQQGTKLQADRDFIGAIDKYNAAIQKDSSFAEAYHQAGGAYTILQKPEGALAYYIELTRRFADNPRYIGAQLKVAEASFAVGEYTEALKHADIYLSFIDSESKYHSRATAIKRNSQFALTRIEHPLNFSPRPLKSPLNQFKQQYFPVLSADQTSLFFIKRDESEQIYVASKIDKEGWSVPVPIDSAITSKYNEGTCSVSADGRTMVFTSCMRNDGYGSCDLYVTYKTGEHWSKPKNIGRPINSSAWDSQPALTADGKTLFYVSDRKGGVGQRDIWMSHLLAAGGWSNPKNLGPGINTKRDDISPFIHVNEQTLFFATDARTGFGGFDIYFSEKDSSGNWGKPQNFGYPINSHNDELAMFITADGSQGYYSHETKKGKELLSKLYVIDIPEEITLKHRSSYVSGKVYDSLTSKPLRANIQLFNMSTNRAMSQVFSDSVNGKYLMVLTEGAEYALFIEAENYLFKSYHFDLAADSIGMAGIIANIALSPIEEGEKTTLNSVLFELDSYALSEKSHIALLFVADYLKNHPDLHIEIAGHTDDIGTDAYNLTLSENRAAAVYDFLLANGVEPETITYQGYGSSQPVASNKNDNGRAKNRRIELVIKN